MYQPTKWKSHAAAAVRRNHSRPLETRVGSVLLRAGRCSKNLIHQTSDFDEKAFLYGALMFFEWAFDPVHVITISIRHSSNYSILAGRRVTKKYI
jgi:hypothetical protein